MSRVASIALFSSSYPSTRQTPLCYRRIVPTFAGDRTPVMKFFCVVPDPPSVIRSKTEKSRCSSEDSRRLCRESLFSRFSSPFPGNGRAESESPLLDSRGSLVSANGRALCFHWKECASRGFGLHIMIEVCRTRQVFGDTGSVN